MGAGRDGQKALFGSSIRHNSFIGLSISAAELHRGLHEDRITPSAAAPIVEIQMSMTQFADFITSFGKGEGTPCTIEALGGKVVPSPPYYSKRIHFDDEFGAKMDEIALETSKYYKAISTLLDKPNFGKHDREEIKLQIRMLRQEISKNVPFMKEQFTEQMDRTVLEAKNEVDAFVESKLRSIGLAGLKKELTAMTYATDIAALEEKTSEQS